MNHYFSRMITALDVRETLGDQSDTFLNELTHHNFKRLRVFGSISILFFWVLFMFDVFKYGNGDAVYSSGYKILFFAHVSVLLLLTTAIALAWVRPVTRETVSLSFHRRLISVTLFSGLVNMVVITIGDVLINGSMAAYLGTIFSFASIFLLTHTLCIWLLFSGVTFMNIGLIMVSIQFDQLLTIQMINSITFTIFALALSRITFYYQLREFKARMVIEEKSNEIETRNRELQSAMANIKTLSGLLPICAHCKKIRDDKGYWNQIESYIRDHSDAEFSHGICQDCLQKYYSDL